MASLSECLLQAVLCSEEIQERKDNLISLLKIMSEGDEVTLLGGSEERRNTTAGANNFLTSDE